MFLLGVPPTHAALFQHLGARTIRGSVSFVRAPSLHPHERWRCVHLRSPQGSGEFGPPKLMTWGDPQWSSRDFVIFVPIVLCSSSVWRNLKRFWKSRIEASWCTLTVHHGRSPRKQVNQFTMLHFFQSCHLKIHLFPARCPHALDGQVQLQKDHFKPRRRRRHRRRATRPSGLSIGFSVFVIDSSPLASPPYFEISFGKG